MINKFYIVFGFLLLLIGGMAGFKEQESTTGAPPARTDAPGEKNCTTSGCHDDFAPNPGPGTPFIHWSNDDTTYRPGRTYRFKVGIQQDSIQRFGFEVTLLQQTTDTTVGQFVLYDTLRTQVMEGPDSFAKRQYVTYTFNGTDPVDTGKGQWTLEWEAPSRSKGPVTIYLAAMAANNDGTEDNDEAYFKRITLQPDVSAARSTITNAKALNVYPQPAHDRLHWQYDIPPGPGRVRVIHVSGQVMYQRQLKSFTNSRSIDVSGWEKGIYVFELKQASRIIHRKIMVY